MTPLFLSLKQAASLLGVSHWTVRGWIASNVLRSAKLPGKNGKGRLDKILIPVAEIDRLIAKATSDAETRARLPKGPSVLDQILTERTHRLRIVQKPKQKGRR